MGPRAGRTPGRLAWRPHREAFLPQDAFDEVIQEGARTFARKGDVYLGLCSWWATMWQDYAQDELDLADFTQSFDLVADGPPPASFDDPSIAAMGPDNVWIVDAGTAAEYADFADFRAAIGAASVVVATGDSTANQIPGDDWVAAERIVARAE